MRVRNGRRRLFHHESAEGPSDAWAEVFPTKVNDSRFLMRQDHTNSADHFGRGGEGALRMRNKNNANRLTYSAIGLKLRRTHRKEAPT